MFFIKKGNIRRKKKIGWSSSRIAQPDFLPESIALEKRDLEVAPEKRAYNKTFI